MLSKVKILKYKYYKLCNCVTFSFTVVVDRGNVSTALTGNFELIKELNIPRLPYNMILGVEGKAKVLQKSMGKPSTPVAVPVKSVTPVASPNATIQIPQNPFATVPVFKHVQKYSQINMGRSSQDVLNSLARRILNSKKTGSGAAKKSPNQCIKPYQHLPSKVDRLIELNKKISRLLHSRAGSVVKPQKFSILKDYLRILRANNSSVFV